MEGGLSPGEVAAPLIWAGGDAAAAAAYAADYERAQPKAIVWEGEGGIAREVVQEMVALHGTKSVMVLHFQGGLTLPELQALDQAP